MKSWWDMSQTQVESYEMDSWDWFKECKAHYEKELKDIYLKDWVKLEDIPTLEKLAELEHNQWAVWTLYFLNHFTCKDLIEKWKFQMVTKYVDLSEEDKEKDRKWARKVLDLIHNPTQLNKDTSSKQSLGESEVSNNQHQVEGSETTSVSLASGSDESHSSNSRAVTMQINNVFKLIDNGDLDETDFDFACPYCNEEIEWSGLNYWFCYKCQKKIFREDFKL